MSKYITKILLNRAKVTTTEQINIKSCMYALSLAAETDHHASSLVAISSSCRFSMVSIWEMVHDWV